MTKIMYVGKHDVVDIPTLEEKSPGRIARGQGADVDPALANELLKGKDWEAASESYAPVVMTLEQAQRAERETAHLKLAAKKAKAYDPQASVKAFDAEEIAAGGDVVHAPTPVIDAAPPGAPGTPESANPGTGETTTEKAKAETTTAGTPTETTAAH